MTETLPILSSDERAVLEVMGRAPDYCHGFDTIGSDSQLPSATIPHLVRLVAAKGLARFSRGLFTDDGMAAGSGYGITPLSLRAMNSSSKLQADVVRLVIAARVAAYDDHPSRVNLHELDRAAEAFASRVPWENEPETQENCHGS